VRKITAVVLLVLLSWGFSARAAGLPDDSDTASPKSGTATPAASPAPSASREHLAVGVGVKVSTLGIGGEAAVPLTHRSNVRVGFNLFSYGHTFDKDGVTYKGSLDLRSVQATYDVFLLGGFHVSPGVLIYNGNQVTANASVPGGKTFTLSNTTYLSDAADPVAGTGKLTVYKAAPMVLFGFGNLVPRSSRHFTATVEFGAAYQGPPRVTLNLTGSACDPSGVFCRSVSSDPTIQSNIISEQAKLNKSASPYRFYPVISFGFGYKF
jgi:hypothetical protein